jgi:hypothetical protein
MTDPVAHDGARTRQVVVATVLGAASSVVDQDELALGGVPGGIQRPLPMVPGNLAIPPAMHDQQGATDPLHA